MFKHGLIDNSELKSQWCFEEQSEADHRYTDCEDEWFQSHY